MSDAQKNRRFLAIVGGGIALLLLIWALGKVGDPGEEVSVSDVPQESTGGAPVGMGAGREFMQRVPCADVMTEYRTVSIAGHDAGVMHVSNVYNIKSDFDPYISASDAAARVNQCR